MNQQQLAKAQQEVEAELGKALTETMYPKEYIHETFNATLSKSLLSKTPASLNASWETFNNLAVNNGSLNLADMGIALNSITGTTPEKLGYSDVSDYTRDMKPFFEMAAKWNDIVKPLREGIVRKHEARLRISNGLPVGKTIKLEA